MLTTAAGTDHDDPCRVENGVVRKDRCLADRHILKSGNELRGIAQIMVNFLFL
jgi:hypothetical protein